MTDDAKHTPSRSPVAAVRELLAGGDLGLLPVIVALVAIWIVFQILNPHFITARNFSNLIAQIAVIGVLALGETFVLFVGEIDLSIAQVMGMTAAILASLSVFDKVNPWVAMAVAILGGSAFGLIQGFWITIVGVPAFIVTLAGSLASLGILLAIIGTYGTISLSDPTLLAITEIFVPSWLSWTIAGALTLGFAAMLAIRRTRRIAAGLKAIRWSALLLRALVMGVVSLAIVAVLSQYHGVPWIAVILVGLIGLFAFITRSTPYGRHIYAIGGNNEAARRAGINIRTIRMSIFTLAGALAGAAGIVSASRLGSASASTGGGNLLLDTIAAAVIGGTSLFGGRGSVYGALAGALVLGSLENGMDLVGAPSSTRFLSEGIILLLAVSLDTLLRRRRMKAGRG